MREVISVTEKGREESKTQGDTAETSGATEAELKKEGKRKRWGRTKRGCRKDKTGGGWGMKGNETGDSEIEQLRQRNRKEQRQLWRQRARKTAPETCPH